MARPQKVDAGTVDAWLSAHAGWEREGDKAIAKTFKFADFSAALAFVVRVGMEAEKKDHHPDVVLGWGKARIAWSTHDAGGTTDLDFALADGCDKIYKA